MGWTGLEQKAIRNSRFQISFLDKILSLSSYLLLNFKSYLLVLLERIMVCAKFCNNVFSQRETIRKTTSGQRLPFKRGNNPLAFFTRHVFLF